MRHIEITKNDKILGAVDIIAVIITIIYSLFLKEYNKTLHQIASCYEERILQIWYMGADDRFWKYFSGGIFCGLILIAVTAVLYYRHDSLVFLIVFMMVNFIIFGILIVTFSNPIFTTAMVLLAGAGGILAASG